MKSIFLLMVSIALSAQIAHSTIITVMASDFVFTPANVTAQVGDTIRWVWSNGDHTTTSTVIPAGAATWNAPITSTATTFSYKLTVAGTYNYVCTPHAPGMAGTISVSPAAVGEPGMSSVRIAPNPANNVLEIILPDQNKNTDVKLLDMQGRLVYEGSVVSGKPLSIPTGSFPAGIYQVVLNQEGTRHSESVVIRH